MLTVGYMSACFFVRLRATARGWITTRLPPSFPKTVPLLGCLRLTLASASTVRGGGVFAGDRDKALATRRILVNYYRNGATRQIVRTFNETTPRSGADGYAYKHFLWCDATADKGNFSLV